MTQRQLGTRLEPEDPELPDEGLVGPAGGPRVSTFLAVDQTESSAVLERLGEGRVASSRTAYLTLLRTAWAAHHGRELYRHDERLLVAFDTPSEAVACAVAVQRACERHNRRLSDRIDARIGIQLGEADESTAVNERGDVVARPAIQAAQLCDAASGGQALVSDLVSLLAREGGSFHFEPVGLIDIDGEPEPMSAFEVTHEGLGGLRLPLPPGLAARPAGRCSFIGRRAEREQLRASWTAAADGARRLAFVMGEPGIGKSRLAAEFASEAHADGAVVLAGRSFEESIVPYQPFVEALRQYIADCDPADLETQLGGDPAPLVTLLPELATRVPVAAPGGSDASERYRLFDAVAALLSTISMSSPVLLVLDDLQWADQATLLLLKHIALDPRPASILILCLYRDTEVGASHPLTGLQADVERDFHVDRTILGGLEGGEVAGMLDEMIGWSPPETVSQGLRDDTEGNPFFLQEVIHQLDETGVAADRERMTRGHLVSEELGVPTRIRDFVARRMQRLAPEALEVLGVAAVVGSEFELPVLETVLERDGLEVLDQLDEAVDARLAVEVPGRTGVYAFGHALFQHVLYEGLSVNRRAALHAQVGEAIEALRPDDPATLSDLARHYALTAGRYAEKVVHYGSAAGEQALAGLAYEDAVEEYSRALEALPLVASAGEQTRADLLVRLGEAQTRAGDAAAAKSSFLEASSRCSGRSCAATLARAALGYGGTAGFGGVWESLGRVDVVVIDLLERALEACDDDAIRVRLLGRLAQALYWSDEKARMLDLSAQALEVARRLDDPAALAYALDSRHVALWEPEHAAELRKAADEMLAIGTSVGDPDIQLKAYAWLITDALETDPIGVVDEYIAEHARLADELHQPYHLWYTEVTRAMRAHLDGRFEDMASLAQSAFVLGQQPHGANAEQTRLVHMFILSLETGRLEDLVDDLAGYVARSPLPAWRAALAMAYAALDRPEDASRELAYFANDAMAELPRDCVWLATLAQVAQVVAKVGAVEAARAMYELLEPYAGRNCVVGGGIMCLGPISWSLGLLAVTFGDAVQALRHLSQALARCQENGWRPFAARIETTMAMILLAAGEDEGVAQARELLDDAVRTATETGMAGLAREAGGLLATVGEPTPGASV